MKKLDLGALTFECKCPRCKQWWVCDINDLKKESVNVRVAMYPGRLGSPKYQTTRTQYFVCCAECQTKIIVDVHPALAENV